MHSSIAVANELYKIHRRKRIGLLPLRRILKYIHICDVMCYAFYERKLVEELTMYCQFGPMYEGLMREMEGFGNRDLSCELILPRYNIDGEFIGRFIPSIKEKLFLELIEMVYDVFSQQTDQELMDFVLLSSMPVGLAKKEKAMYVKMKHIKEACVLLKKENDKNKISLMK